MLNVVNGFGHTAGAAISSHMDVDAVSSQVFHSNVNKSRRQIHETFIIYYLFFDF